MNINMERADELIGILGEKKIWQVYNLLGSTKISFAMLVKLLRKRLWLADLKTNKFTTVVAFAKAYGVSPRTVYRALKKLYKKK